MINSNVLMRRNLGFVSLAVLASLVCSPYAFAMEENDESFSESEALIVLNELQNQSLKRKENPTKESTGAIPTKKARRDPSGPSQPNLSLLGFNNNFTAQQQDHLQVQHQGPQNHLQSTGVPQPLTIAPPPPPPSLVMIEGNVPPTNASASQTQPVTPEHLKALIEQVKQGSAKAQDELINIYFGGSYRHLITLEAINFLSWADIQKNCYEKDEYAYFAIVHFEEVGSRFPELLSKVTERANQNISAAQYNLGWMYKKGSVPGGKSEENDKIAVESILKAAAQNFAPAQIFLGTMYLGGSVPGGKSEANDKIGVEWLEKAAVQGNAHTQYTLGLMYKEGSVPGGKSKENDKIAVEWLEKAAAKGHAPAQCSLGFMYQEGRVPGRKLEANDKIAVEWFKKSAAQGNAQAECSLGLMYKEGRVPGGKPEANDKIAVEWLKKAAAQGHAPAKNSLGLMYKEGRVPGGKSEANDKIGVEWLEKAAAQGNAPAKNNLGLMYKKGRVSGGKSEKNDKIAVGWFKKAAAKSFAPAQANLSLMYKEGRVPGGKSEANDKIAVELIQKAAAKSFAPAQYNLGAMYRNGCGVEKNFIEGLHWMIKSKSQMSKSVIRENFSINPNAPMNGDSFKTSVFAFKQSHQNTLNNNTGLGAEFSDLYKSILALRQDFVPTIDSLLKVKPVFMVTAIHLHEELIPLLSKQITPFFSVDEVEGVSYLTWGEENVRTAKRIMTFLQQLDDGEKQLERDFTFFKMGADAQVEMINSDSQFIQVSSKKPLPFSLKIQEELEQVRYVKTQLKSIIHQGAGSRNHDALEDDPRLRE